MDAKTIAQQVFAGSGLLEGEAGPGEALGIGELSSMKSLSNRLNKIMTEMIESKEVTAVLSFDCNAVAHSRVQEPAPNEADALGNDWHADYDDSASARCKAEKPLASLT